MNELEKMEKELLKEWDKNFKNNTGWITPKIKSEMTYDMALKIVQDATEEEMANRIVELYNCIEVNSMSIAELQKEFRDNSWILKAKEIAGKQVSGFLSFYAGYLCAEDNWKK